MNTDLFVLSREMHYELSQYEMTQLPPNFILKTWAFTVDFFSIFELWSFNSSTLNYQSDHFTVIGQRSFYVYLGVRAYWIANISNLKLHFLNLSLMIRGMFGMCWGVAANEFGWWCVTLHNHVVLRLVLEISFVLTFIWAQWLFGV